MSFANQYDTPEWQQKKNAVYVLHGWKCQECGSTSKLLHAHHPWYELGKPVWDYPDEFFKCWCDECHKKFHILKRRLLQALALCSFGRIGAVVAYATAVAQGKPLDEVVRPGGEKERIKAALGTTTDHQEALALLRGLQKLG